jgi:hypothetical protein
MASQTELEELVVRLTGEASGYLKMLTEAQQKTKEAGKEVEKEAGKIEKFKEALEGFQKKAGSVLTSIGIGIGIEAAIEKFDKAELAAKRMEATLEANGRQVSNVTADYTKFAKEMAKVSDVSKGTTLNMLQQAEMMGLTGEKAKQAVKNAMSMAAIKGVDDPSQFLRHMVLFSQGKDARLAAMLGIGAETEDDNGKHQEIQERLTKGMKLVEIAGQTSEARFARAKAAMGSVATEVGEVASKYVDKFAEIVEKLANGFKELPSWVRTSIVSFTLLIAVIEPAILVIDFMTARFAAMQVVMSGVSTYLMALPAKIMAGVAAFNAMSMSAQLASVAIGSVFAIAVIAATVLVLKLIAAQEKFNEGLKKSAELSEQFRNRQAAASKPGLDAVKHEEDLNERRRLAGPQIAENEKQIKQLEEAKNRAERMLQHAQDAITPGKFWINKETGQRVDAQPLSVEGHKEVAIRQDAVDNAKKALEQMQDIQKQLKAALEIDPKAIEDINKLIEKHKEEAITAGMTADQLEIYNAQKKVGENNPIINALRENQQLAEQAKKTADATKTVEDYIEQTKIKIETDGMSADEMVIYKAQLANVDEALVKQAKDIADASKAQEQYNKFLEEGRQMTLEFLTPLEKYEDRVGAIFDQFEAGNIGPETFAAAMQKATDDLDQATNAAEKAESAIQSVNQAMMGTAEVNSKLYNYAAEQRGAQEATTNKFLGKDVNGASTRPVVNKLEDLRVLLARIADREDTGGVDFEGADL